MCQKNEFDKCHLICNRHSSLSSSEGTLVELVKLSIAISDVKRHRDSSNLNLMNLLEDCGWHNKLINNVNMTLILLISILTLTHID